MHPLTPNRRLLQLIVMLVSLSFVAVAQDVAIVSSMRGKVLIKRASGQTQQGFVRIQLSPGDEVSTSSDASAIVMYFTGKEVYMAANKNYIVVGEKGEDPFLRRLAGVFANLLWSNKPSKSVLGASRGWKEGDKRVIKGIYPSMNALPDPVLRFEWIDTHPKPGRKYEVILRDDLGKIEKSTTVSDTNVALVRTGSAVLSADARHRWQVRDLKSGQQSEETVFSFLTRDEQEKLTKSLGEIRTTCAQDDARRYLLESLLFTDLNMMMQAEASLRKFTQMKPDVVIGHELLAQVYAKVGKFDESIAEQDIVATMLKAK